MPDSTKPANAAANADASTTPQGTIVSVDAIKAMVMQSDEPVLSLYLNVDASVDENQAQNPAWRIWIKNELRERDATLNEVEGYAAVRAKLDTFMETYEPEGRTLAYFASPSFEDVFHLPVRLENRVHVGKPLVTPILWAIDEYEPYLIVLVDQEKARYFTARLGSIGFQQGIELDIDDYDFQQRTSTGSSTPAGVAGGTHGGSGRDDHEGMLDEFRARFYRSIVDEITRTTEAQIADRPRRILFGGSEPSAHAVINLMPEKQKAMVVDTLALPMRFSPSEIQEHAQTRALAYERDQEMEIVRQVIDFAKSRGRGALGLKDVEMALTMQRVELLVLPYPLDDEMSELSLKAFASGGGVELVSGEAADLLKAEGGVAARLYYAL